MWFMGFCKPLYGRGAYNNQNKIEVKINIISA